MTHRNKPSKYPFKSMAVGEVATFQFEDGDDRMVFEGGVHHYKLRWAMLHLAKTRGYEFQIKSDYTTWWVTRVK